MRSIEKRGSANRTEKKRKRMETSKKMTLVNYIIFIAVSVATFVALFKGYEISSLVTFDLGVLGLVTTWNAVYCWKARAENLLKISKAYEMDEDVVKDLLLSAAKEVIGSNNGNIY